MSAATRYAATTAALTAAAVVAASLLLPRTAAPYNAVDTNPNSTFESAATFPCAANQAAAANADANLDEKHPDNNYGTEVELLVESKKTNNDSHIAVQFPLTVIPDGCRISSATLQLYTTQAEAGRTIIIDELSSTFSETTITWNNAPTPTGNSVAVPSLDAAAVPTTTSWDITPIAAGMTNTNTLVLRLYDSVGEANGGIAQVMHTRENTNPPVLQLTVEPDV